LDIASSAISRTAALPQPNDRGEIKAFGASPALCRTALPIPNNQQNTAPGLTMEKSGRRHLSASAFS
jgi:hypothetical protein